MTHQESVLSDDYCVKCLLTSQVTWLRVGQWFMALMHGRNMNLLAVSESLDLEQESQ
jgi:hypothetical protein